MNPLTRLRRALGTARRQFSGLPQVELQPEVEPYLRHLKGIVLNAGAGHRPIQTALPTINTDFDETAAVDFFSDLHYLPLASESVDSVLSVAVLEHTRLPWVCAAELYRVMQPGGTLVIAVPFLQPEHAVPHDYFRYTVYGLRSMLEYVGFEVESVTRIGRYERTLAWVLQEKWKRSGLFKVPLMLLVNLIARRAKIGERPPYSVYTGSYAVAHKPGAWQPRPALDTTRPNWYRPLLVDPVTKTALTDDKGDLVGESSRYTLLNGVLDLRPPQGLSQDSQHKWGSFTHNQG